MSSVGEYLLRITAAALICSILQSLPFSGSLSKLMQILCGLFLLVTILSPFADISIKTGQWSIDSSYSNADEIIASANDAAHESMKEIIIKETEAYILDKAKKFGAELMVEVSVDDSEFPIPIAVVIRGSVSPYARQQLQQIIADDLGIGTEGQNWIG